MTTLAPPPDADSTTEPEGSHTHAVPARVLIGVFACLLVLTAATYGAAHLDLGPWNVPLALGIAVLKAALVALFFMHLFYDRLFNAVILIVAMLFVMLFITLALVDTEQYQHDIQANTQSPTGGK